jgi:adenylate cyclase
VVHGATLERHCHQAPTCRYHGRRCRGLDAARAILKKEIESHQGRVVDMAGDSVLAVFETAGGAAAAALEIQSNLRPYGASADGGMLFRMGVHLGDIIKKVDGSVYGDGVNVAARLQELAGPGGITISDGVHSAIRDRAEALFEDQGEHSVKNIA